jgi:O-antigen ligase
LTELTELIGARLTQAHNGYLEAYVNIGWIGLFFLAIVILGGYRNVLDSLRASGDVGGLKLAFYFICIVSNFTEASFAITSPTWIVFLWAAMAGPVSTGVGGPPRRKPRHEMAAACAPS